MRDNRSYINSSHNREVAADSAQPKLLEDEVSSPSDVVRGIQVTGAIFCVTEMHSGRSVGQVKTMV